MSSTLDRTAAFLEKRDGIDKVGDPQLDMVSILCWTYLYCTDCERVLQVLKVIRYAAKLLIAQGAFDGAAHLKLKAVDSSLGTTRYAVQALHDLMSDEISCT